MRGYDAADVELVSGEQVLSNALAALAVESVRQSKMEGGRRSERSDECDDRVKKEQEGQMTFRFACM